MSYANHAVNNSPTIHGIAGDILTNPAMLAVRFNPAGKFVLPAPDGMAFGIVLADQATALIDEGVDVQIKDICYWIAGGIVAAGSELASDVAGKAIVAVGGRYIIAIALEAGVANQPIMVQIAKAGYKPV